jgi:hypothetical protein
MESHFATEAVAHLRRRSWRAAAVNLAGPLTMLAGVVWAFVQPYRLTFLHPHGQGFWWLFSEPPLYVVLVGLAFALFLAPALIQDLQEAEDAAEG